MRKKCRSALTFRKIALSLALSRKRERGLKIEVCENKSPLRITKKLKLKLKLKLNLKLGLTLPFPLERLSRKRCGRRIRSATCLSAASWSRFPPDALLARDPEGQHLAGRLSLITFFGEAKKVISRRATPGMVPREQISTPPQVQMHSAPIRTRRTPIYLSAPPSIRHVDRCAHRDSETPQILVLHQRNNSHHHPSR